MVNKSRRNNDGLEGILDNVVGVFDDLEEKAFMGGGNRKSAVQKFFSSPVGLGFPRSEGSYNQARQVYYTDLQDPDAESNHDNITSEDEQRDDRYASSSSERRQNDKTSSRKQRRESLSREASSSFREQPLVTRISSQPSLGKKVSKSAHLRPPGKSALKAKAEDKYSICEEKKAPSKPKKRGEESSDTPPSYGWASDYSKFRKKLQEKDGKPPVEEPQLSMMAKLLSEEEQKQDLKSEIDTPPLTKKSKKSKKALASKSKQSNVIPNSKSKQINKVTTSKPKEASVVSVSKPKQASVTSTTGSKQASVTTTTESKQASDNSSSNPQPMNKTVPNQKTFESRESSQDTYMDELKAKLERGVTQRRGTIESLIASRRAIQVEEQQQIVEPVELVPPPKYSLSQVKHATAFPSSQDAFMNELKGWHTKYSLRKVTSEEKQRKNQTNEIQSKQLETAQNAQMPPAEEQKTETKSKKWVKFSKLFKRKQRSKHQKEDSFIVEGNNDSNAETEPKTTPQSLVELRKKELESFFVAYTQTIHKEKSQLPPPETAAAVANKESYHDEFEEGTEVQLSKGGSGVSQGVSSLTIPVPPAVILTVQSKGKRENVSELSSKEKDQGSLYSSSVDSKKENRNEEQYHDGHIMTTTTSGVTWKDIQPNNVVVATKRQHGTPPSPPLLTTTKVTTSRSISKKGRETTKQRSTTTNKPRGGNKKSKNKPDAIRTSSKSKQNTNNTKNRKSSNSNDCGKSTPTTTSSSPKPSSAAQGASLFGNNSSITMTEAERRRRERKARLSQTLF